MNSSNYDIMNNKKPKKRTALDARMINMSGIGTYIKHLVKAGIYDIALGNEEEIKKYTLDIDVIDYNCKIYGIKEQLRFPYRKLKKMEPDILHIPHYNVPMFYRGKMYVTIHDLTHLIMPELLPNKFAYYYAKIMLWVATHKAEKIFTVSENTKQDIIKYFKINPEKIMVTYNGVDLDEFKEKDKSEYSYLYNKYSIPRSKKIIMYAGNLKPHKNLKRLLEAFKDIDEKDNTILILVGKAFENHNIIDFEKEYGIKNRVIHTGVVTQAELVDFYNLADLFVFPSIYEGFGIPPLEAMACGTPVACSNTSSLPEVVGDSALMFDPLRIDEIRNAINVLLKNPSVASTLIKKGFERCKKFNWTNCVNIVNKNF